MKALENFFKKGVLVKIHVFKYYYIQLTSNAHLLHHEELFAGANIPTAGDLSA